MKSPSIFKEYIWLLNTIHKAKRITLEEISKQWMQTEMSGGLPLPRSSFNRHIDAIEDIFGIYIECDRSNGYKYYIANEKVLQEDTIQNWMLSTLIVNNLITENRSVENRILLEQIPSDGENLKLAIEAMKQNHVITVKYKKYDSAETKEMTIEPYCVKLYHRRWYLLARYHNDEHEFRTLSFDRIMNLIVTETTFEIDHNFNVEEHYQNCFGIVSGDETPVQRIVIRAFDTESAYLRDLPIHSSQREISSEDNYSDFELFLRPTLDFKGYIVSRANRIKIIEPLSLASDIKSMLQASLELY